MSLKEELIYIDGNNRTDNIVSYRFIGMGSTKDKCAIKFKNNDTEYFYSASKVKIVKSAIHSEKSNNLFQYLNQIADTVGLTTEEGKNILADSYSKITFIPEYSILANFLNRTQPTGNIISNPIEIFPFGFNLSQKEAVNKAFTSSLSVIEGPPGTGKTQTILNIIANAVMNGQSVAVVSSNNSATKNVYEKLQKNGIEFIAALLGNSTNKKEFIDSQTDIPDLSQFNLLDKEKSNTKHTCENLFNQLSEYLLQKNELAVLKQELDSLTTEYKHFQKENEVKNNIVFSKSTTSAKILALWVAIENQALTNKKLTWWYKLLNWFRYGKKEKTLFEIPTEEAILICQSNYYPVKIDEIKKRQNSLETSLNGQSDTWRTQNICEKMNNTLGNIFYNMTVYEHIVNIDGFDKYDEFLFKYKENHLHSLMVLHSIIQKNEILYSSKDENVISTIKNFRSLKELAFNTFSK